jgi:hypothetical protein
MHIPQQSKHLQHERQTYLMPFSMFSGVLLAT